MSGSVPEIQNDLDDYDGALEDTEIYPAVSRFHI